MIKIYFFLISIFTVRPEAYYYEPLPVTITTEHGITVLRIQPQNRTI